LGEIQNIGAPKPLARSQIQNLKPTPRSEGDDTPWSHRGRTAGAFSGNRGEITGWITGFPNNITVNDMSGYDTLLLTVLFLSHRQIAHHREARPRASDRLPPQQVGWKLDPIGLECGSVNDTVAIQSQKLRVITG
jgi:hypothetical protein